MNQPSPSSQLQHPEMLLSPAGSTASDADDVTRSKLTRQLAQRTKIKVQVGQTFLNMSSILLNVAIFMIKLITLDK